MAERNESVLFERLMEQGAVKRPRQGRPRLRPERVAGDKGYTGRRIRKTVCRGSTPPDTCRTYLQRRGIGAIVPRQTE